MTTTRRQTERGAALLVVMVAVAVLTALAVDLAYESRVSLRIAANARDELRAVHRARSGVALSRLVLSFQQTLDGAAPQGGAISMPRVQLWRLVPVGSELAASLFGEGGAPAAPAAAAVRLARAEDAPPTETPGAHAPAALAGDGFQATIEDEGAKVNVHLEASNESTGGLQVPVQAIHQLVCDPRWDPLFEREDDRGVRISREDVLVHLKDWIDLDAEASGLVAAFGATSCETLAAAVPFEKAFGDENRPYDRGEDRYRAKNARMDSLDELYLVAGIGDAFMAAFGDALTVYLPRGEKPNVNDTSRDGLLRNAGLVVDPPSRPLLRDPAFVERLEQLVLDRTFGGVVALSAKDFLEAVRTAGAGVNAALLAAKPEDSPFADRSTTFRIRATGAAGDVRKTLDAVVRLGNVQQGQPVAAPGRLVHWREE